MNALKFARELARFEEHLDWITRGGGGGHSYGEDAELAASFKVLITGLVELEEHLDSVELSGGVRRIPEILSEAIAVFYDRQHVSNESWQKARDAREAEYAEAVRRHELAITVGCPFCGAQPGETCRTKARDGFTQPKGVNDHKDRYRAASDPEWKRAADSRA